MLNDSINLDLHYLINHGNRHATHVVTVLGGGEIYFPLTVTSEQKFGI